MLAHVFRSNGLVSRGLDMRLFSLFIIGLFNRIARCLFIHMSKKCLAAGGMKAYGVIERARAHSRFRDAVVVHGSGRGAAVCVRIGGAGCRREECRPAAKDRWCARSRPGGRRAGDRRGLVMPVGHGGNYRRVLPLEMARGHRSIKPARNIRLRWHLWGLDGQISKLGVDVTAIRGFRRISMHGQWRLGRIRNVRRTQKRGRGRTSRRERIGLQKNRRWPSLWQRIHDGRFEDLADLRFLSRIR